MDTVFVRSIFRRLGAGLWLDVEQVEDGQRQFSLEGVQRMRVATESAALRALDNAGVGKWSAFPPDAIHATVTRLQLRAIGFRGNY